jgi:hypothetical protein
MKSSDTNITIYSRSAHIIQKKKYQDGTIMLPKFVNVSSILLLDEDNNVIPFSYLSEINSNTVPTDRLTGNKVEVQVIKNEKTIKGKILSITQDNVTLLSNNQVINIRKYDQVLMPVADDLTQPQLLISSEYNNNILTLSYLINNISWECVATALIDEENNMMYLRLAGDITNNTEFDINAETTLVSGDVYQQHSEPTYKESRMLMASAPSNKVSSSMLEDYVKYNVGERLIRNKDVAELGTISYPINKLYIHKTQDGNVKFGYRLTATEFVPACTINVFSYKETIDSFLGSTTIEEKQVNDEVDVMLGESSLLQCNSTVIVSDDITIDNEEKSKKYKLSVEEKQWHVVTEDINVEITNHTNKNTFLIIKHYVGNKLLVDIGCEAYKKRNNGYLEWYFDIPASTNKETFTCKVITATQY